MTAADRHALWQQLMRHEGLRLRPYVDTVGKLTIGVGRNITDKGITHQEAMMLLEHDVDECERDCVTFPWFAGLDVIRQRVLLDLRFNVGPTGFRGFKNMIAAVARRDYEKAALELLDSKWSTQVQTRATRLAQMMLSGEDSAV